MEQQIIQKHRMSDTTIQGIGKIKSKYLIFEFFAHACPTRLDFTSLLFTSSTSTRRLLIRNLPLLTRTHPILSLLAIASPFDIIVNANPLPKHVYLQLEFHMRDHYMQQMEQIAELTNITVKGFKLKLDKDTNSESENRLLNGMARYKPTKLTIKFVSTDSIQVSLIPPTVQSLVLIGNLKSINGLTVAPLKVRSLFAKLNGNSFILQNVGTIIIPTKKLTWHISSNGPEITEEWLKQIPTSVQVALFIEELTPAHIFISKYPHATLKAQYCNYDKAEIFNGSTNIKYAAIKFFLDDLVYTSQLNDFLSLPHPVKQIEFDKNDRLQIELSHLQDNATQELIFESAQYKHVPLIAGLVNKCFAVTKVRFSRMVHGRSINDRNSRVTINPEDPKKTFQDKKITWDRVMDEIEFREYGGMNEEWSAYFRYLKNNTKKLVHQKNEWNSINYCFSNSTTIEHIVKNFCYEGIDYFYQKEDSYNLGSYPNLKDAIIQNYRKKFVHTFGSKPFLGAVQMERSYSHTYVASKLFIGKREFPYKDLRKESWFCSIFTEIPKHAPGTVSFKYYRKEIKEDYINFKTAMQHLQPQLFKSAPPTFKDPSFNDFVRIYNHFGAQFVNKKCGGLSKVNKAHCKQFLKPIFQAIQPDPNKMRDIERITNCYNIEPKTAAQMFMDFSILTYTARDFNNKNITVVRKETQNVIKRYLQNLAREKYETSMLADYLSSSAKVLYDKEPSASALQLLASEVQELDASIDAFQFIKQKLIEA
ncbi:hypothetical protein FGO68_gene7697 [Halteria grandinella]|uniref:Uncharacterized protein n=1 Tax=Halteria grandinella TaxID=5974 RepID=A0A8J8NYA7_HALGN|nr:hypothetical protein FGO68_gene7697 [Halteria grandinella]